MQSAYIINDRTGKPYAVVGILPGGTEFYPIAESAVSWASWMTADFAAKKISKQELSVTLDNSMSVEGPMPVNRANKAKIDELIKKAKKFSVESDKEKEIETEEKTLLPVISLLDARLDNLENADWRNAVNFKAKSFIADANKSTFAYEIKRTRAVWDPSLSIPGTERRGGFRCPPGTRYGGQITDRFGRNCGWGVARRLANEIADLGERIENVDDRRRARRVNRRNERMVRRLQQGGRVERAARAIGNALESGPAEDRGPGRLERAARRVGEALETRQPRSGPGRLERAARRVAEALETDNNNNTPAPRRPRRPAAPQARPARPRQPRNGRPAAPQARPASRNNRYRDMNDADLLKEWENNKPYRPSGGRVGMNPLIEDEKAKRRKEIEDEMLRRGMDLPAGAQPRINIPTDEFVPEAQPQGRRPAPRRPRQIDLVDNTSKTPVPAGAPRANETLEQYKRRKYNEHQARVRKIRDEGGNAGFLRYEEWEQFYGQEFEDNWNRAQARNGGRGARRVATNAGAGRSASRRPGQNAEPDAVQPARRRQRLPFKPYGHQRGFASEEAAFRKLDALERQAMEANDLQMREPAVVELNGKFYVVENAVDLQKAIDAGGRKRTRGAQAAPQNNAPRPATPRPQSPAPAAPQQGNATTVPGIKRFAFVKRKTKRAPDVAPLGDVDSDGFVVAKRVDNGANGINSPAEAARFLENGGSIADIPDEFLNDALMENAANINRELAAYVDTNIIQKLVDDGKIDLGPYNPRDVSRFGHFLFAQAIAASGDELPANLQPLVRGKKFVYLRGTSVTSPGLFFKVSEDGKRLTGEGFIIKPPDGFYENANLFELMGPEIAARMGLPGEGGRVDGIVDGQRAILLPFAGNMIQGKQRAGVFVHKGSKKDRVSHVAMNMVLGVGDRHHLNGMVFKDDDGNDVAVPIDFGRADPIQVLNRTEVLRYFRNFGMDENAGGRRLNPDDIREFNEAGDELVERLKSINWDEMNDRMVEVWRGRNLRPQGNQQPAVAESQIQNQIAYTRARAQVLIDLLEREKLGDILLR